MNHLSGISGAWCLLPWDLEGGNERVEIRPRTVVGAALGLAYLEIEMNGYNGACEVKCKMDSQTAGVIMVSWGAFLKQSRGLER